VKCFTGTAESMGSAEPQAKSATGLVNIDSAGNLELASLHRTAPSRPPQGQPDVARANSFGSAPLIRKSRLYRYILELRRCQSRVVVAWTAIPRSGETIAITCVEELAASDSRNMRSWFSRLSTPGVIVPSYLRSAAALRRARHNISLRERQWSHSCRLVSGCRRRVLNAGREMSAAQAVCALLTRPPPAYSHGFT
jgi:hypothetical protein